MRKLIILLSVFIAGCALTKPVEIPVPVPCSKPKNLLVPHDYVANLDRDARANRFVPACLATIESYKNSYEACAIVNK